jgi:hypothetical protein
MPNFEKMQVQLNIEFDQLVTIVKKLPLRQWTKLKQEVEKQETVLNEKNDLETFLLAAPTFSNKQLDVIEKSRKDINQWRKN